MTQEQLPAWYLKVTKRAEQEAPSVPEADDWLNAHRFDLDTALRLAKEQAPLVTVNGHTVSDALAMQQKRAERDG